MCISYSNADKLLVKTTKDDIPDEEVIKEKVQAYTALLQQYSMTRGKNDSNLYCNLIALKDGHDMQQNVANDLSNESNDKHVHFGAYITQIDKIPDDSLVVNYDNDHMQVLDCVVTMHTDTGDVRFKYVKFNKTLSLNGRTKTFTEIAAVNLKSGKIPETYFPDDPAFQNTSCYTQVKTFGTQDEPEAASGPVVVIQKYRPAIKQADALFDNGRYELAINQYQSISLKFPAESKRDNVGNKITLCRSAIETRDNSLLYTKMMNYANYYYNKGIFNRAGEFYESAIRYKPNDSYALAGINRCRNAGAPQQVISIIRNAEQLETTGPNNYGRAFRALSDVEPSGMLNAADYYFLIENLYQKNPIMMREMGYTEEDCENYLNIYRYKLRIAGEREDRVEVRNDALMLLNDIIVSNRSSHIYNRTINYYPSWVIRTNYNRRAVINPYRSGYTRHVNNPFGRNNIYPPRYNGRNQLPVGQRPFTSQPTQRTYPPSQQMHTANPSGRQNRTTIYRQPGVQRAQGASRLPQQSGQRQIQRQPAKTVQSTRSQTKRH